MNNWKLKQPIQKYKFEVIQSGSPEAGAIVVAMQHCINLYDIYLLSEAQAP